MSQAANPHELESLLTACLEGVSTEEQSQRLDRLIGEDPAALDAYVDLMSMHAMLQFRHWPQPAGSPDCGNVSAGSDTVDTNDRPPIVTSFPPPLSSPFATYISSSWPVAYLVATVVFAAALSIAALIHVSRPTDFVQQPDRMAPSANQSPIPSPKTSIVARITGMVDCVWEGSGFRVQDSVPANQKSEITNHNSVLHLGDRLALRSGLLELTYDTGARVILQGPVTYEVESPAGGYLSVGKLTAKLEQKAESPSLSPLPSPLSPLFAVRTPSALVTDLGTEFGVEVDKQGDTMSHVFRGSVRVQRRSTEGTASDAGQVLHESQSAVVEAYRGCRIDVLASPTTTTFVRSIPKPTITSLDLADVSAGGTGYSRRRGSGIDPATGRVVNAYPQDFVVGDGQYHRVPGLPFVDGVFVPNGRNGTVQTDSGGHRFDGFAETSGMTAGCVWAIGDSLRLSPPTARDDLPRKASEEFPYRYEMDYLPTDVSHVDRDRNAQQDFTPGASAAAFVADGILKLTDSSFTAKTPTSIWPEHFSFDQGYTIEARIKVESSSGKEPFALWVTLPAQQSGVGMSLTLGDQELAWDGTHHVQRFACNTTDEYHVYRVVQKPGQKVFSLWRDGVLVSDRLPSDADNGGIAEMGFGKCGQRWQGTSLIDYVRITPGAFAPLPPVESPDDVAAHRHFRSLAATLAQTGPRGVECDGLLLHANAGITFDLKAIRQATGGGRIRQFLATAEMIEAPEDRAEPLANIWILVDGQRRFRLREVNCHHGKHPVSVPLAAEDRFLTLVVTDNGNGVEHGCVLFGRARLETAAPSECHAPDKRLGGASMKRE